MLQSLLSCMYVADYTHIIHSQSACYWIAEKGFLDVLIVSSRTGSSGSCRRLLPRLSLRGAPSFYELRRQHIRCSLSFPPSSRPFDTTTLHTTPLKKLKMSNDATRPLIQDFPPKIIQLNLNHHNFFDLLSCQQVRRHWCN